MKDKKLADGCKNLSAPKRPPIKLIKIGQKTNEEQEKEDSKYSPNNYLMPPPDNLLYMLNSTSPFETNSDHQTTNAAPTPKLYKTSPI